MKSSLLLPLASLLLVFAGCASAPTPVVPPMPVAVHRTATFTLASLPNSEVDVPAKARLRVVPVYPQAFRAAGVAGSAVVAFIIDSDGTPQEVQYVEASDAAFGEAAVAAVRKYRFTPAVKDGHRVAVNGQQLLKFVSIDN